MWAKVYSQIVFVPQKCFTICFFRAEKSQVTDNSKVMLSLAKPIKNTQATCQWVAVACV